MIRIALLFFILISVSVVAQPTLSTRSKKAIELYTEADNYRLRWQYTQAIGMLNETIEKDKKFVEAYYRLGIVYMTLKDYNTAIRHFQQGLSYTTDPKKQKVFWFDLGESFFTLGDYSK